MFLSNVFLVASFCHLKWTRLRRRLRCRTQPKAANRRESQRSEWGIDAKMLWFRKFTSLLEQSVPRKIRIGDTLWLIQKRTQ
jgi:hypothetical protein